MSSKSDLKYYKTNKFDVLLQSNASVFFIDIEETLIAPNLYYELIGDRFFEARLRDLLEGKDVKLADVMYLGKNFRRDLMDESIPEVISKLREQGKRIFALTSGFPSIQKKDQIKHLGIKLHGYLFTRRADKGPFLNKFLQMYNLDKNKCCFMDNHLDKIENVFCEYKSVFPKNSIDLILYKKEFLPSDLSIENFDNYWKSVIQAIADGQLEKLRHRVARDLRR